MGINYVAALGFSPGALTSSLVHVNEMIKRLKLGDKVAQKFLAGLADDNQMQSLLDRAKFESIVIITTEKVLSKETQKPYYINTCGQPLGTGRKEMGNPFGVAMKLIKDENLTRDKQEGCKIYVATTNFDDFRSCFLLVLRILDWLAPEGRTGKNVWMNATGGTNIINNAIILSSFLRQVGRTYYTYVPPDDVACLRPVLDKDGSLEYWNDLPPLHFNLDNTIYLVLKTLVESGKQLLTPKELWSRLQQAGCNSFSDMNNLIFYLNHLTFYIGHAKDNQNYLTKEGQRLYGYLQDDEIRQFILQERGDRPRRMPNSLRLVKEI